MFRTIERMYLNLRMILFLFARPFEDSFYNIVHGNPFSRIVTLGIYTGLVCAFLFKRVLFWVAVGIYLFYVIMTAIYFDSRYGLFEKAPQNARRNVPYFGKLSPKAAKRKYDKLMKMYHSGEMGEDGFAEMAEISKAYSMYLKY